MIQARVHARMSELGLLIEQNVQLTLNKHNFVMMCRHVLLVAVACRGQRCVRQVPGEGVLLRAPRFGGGGSCMQPCARHACRQRSSEPWMHIARRCSSCSRCAFMHACTREHCCIECLLRSCRSRHLRPASYHCFCFEPSSRSAAWLSAGLALCVWQCRPARRMK